jgi:hypothetical protein
VRDLWRGFEYGAIRLWPVLIGYGGVVMMLEDAWLNGTTWVTFGFGLASLSAWGLRRIFDRAAP